ncbi:MAG: hypothetical protein IH953_00695 [Chloroflexi bacterium]|nr:hypothetical protein [Chloroflexota bacterium]
MKTPSDEAAINRLAKEADEHLRSRDIGFELWNMNLENDRESYKALIVGLSLQIETLLSLLRKGEQPTEQDIKKWRDSMQFEIFSMILATISLTVRITDEE